MSRKVNIRVYLNVLNIRINVIFHLKEFLTKTVLQTTKYINKTYFASRIADYIWGN